VKFRSAAAAIFTLLGVAAILGLAILPLFGHSGDVLLLADQGPSALPLSKLGGAAPAEATPVGAPPAGLQSQEPSAESPEINPITLRVGTWNVRDCAAWDNASKERIALHDYVAATIREAEVDILLFQEIQSDESKGGDIALLSVALAKQGWAMPYTAVVNAKGEDDLAVFSRYKIEAQGSVLEPSATDPWPRPGIYAKVEIAQTPLHLYGFHFKAMGDKKSETTRKAQALALVQALAERHSGVLDTDRIIVAGDFNTANPSDLSGSDATLSTLCSLGDQDPSNDFLALNYQFHPDVPSFVDSRYRSVLDHILVSSSLKVGMSQDSIHLIEAVKAQGTIPTSDHKLLLAEIVLAAR
jgi:endonuclease/exonuclease/phosphatase family metal-dependent hydrolase